MPELHGEEEVARRGDLAGLQRNSRLRVSADIDALHAMELDSLRDRWRKVFGSEPQPRLSRELLIRAVAFDLQTKARSGVSKKVIRALERIAAGKDEPGPAGHGVVGALRPGTRLMREWQGKVHEVVVLEKGFLWNGSTYASLSVIGRTITGTRVSGPRFFGTLERQSTPRRAGGADG
jgi:hypothetical protein